jgi:ectoine hydroxylase-related dioxygenase (phytanoyl-CoA dioxygenase family)
MLLNAEELKAFATDGMITKRGFVAPQLVDRAVALITDWYRTDLDKCQLIHYTQRTFAPHLGSHPDVLALFTHSGVADIVRELVGNFAPITTTQIQIRVPEDEFDQVQPEKAMHVDGVACPHLDPNELRTFSLLVGVVLSDISHAASGPLRYVPGGHLRMAEWFRSQWALGITEQVPSHIDAEQGTPLLGKPGDVLFMHHLVPHAVGRNRTATPRIMAYYRVSHVDHASRRLSALRDPWQDFAALNERVQSGQ